MFMERKVKRAMETLEQKNYNGERQKNEFMEVEQQEKIPFDGKDLLAMILAAVLTFLPVFFVLIACVIGVFFLL